MNQRYNIGNTGTAHTKLNRGGGGLRMKFSDIGGPTMVGYERIYLKLGPLERLKIYLPG